MLAVILVIRSVVHRHCHVYPVATMIGRATSQAVIATKPQKWPASETAVEKTHGCQLTDPEGTIITITEIPVTISHI